MSERCAWFLHFSRHILPKINAISRVERTLDKSCYVEIKYFYIYSLLQFHFCLVQAWHVVQLFPPGLGDTRGNKVARPCVHTRPRGRRLVMKPCHKNVQSSQNALITRKIARFRLLQNLPRRQVEFLVSQLKMFSLGLFRSSRILAILSQFSHTHIRSHLNI